MAELRDCRHSGSLGERHSLLGKARDTPGKSHIEEMGSAAITSRDLSPQGHEPSGGRTPGVNLN